MFCPRCASEVSVTDVRCPKCTQYLGGKPDPTEAAKVAKTAAPAAQTVEKPVEQAALHTPPVLTLVEGQTAVAENSVKNQAETQAEIQAEKCEIPLDNPAERVYNDVNKLHKGDKNMFCPHCGNNVESNDTFCNKCGQRVNEAPAAPVETPATEATQFCQYCGSKMPADAAKCPVCAQDVAVAAPAQPVQPVQPVTPVAPVSVDNGEGKSNGVAIAALIVSLAGPILFPFLANIVGLILGIVGVKKSGGLNGKGKGMGIASIVISVLGIVFWVICTVLVFAWLMMIMETNTEMILPMFMI